MRSDNALSACSSAASTSTSPTATADSSVFDIAQINQKGFSEKIVTAPVSPHRAGHEREDALCDGGRRADARSPSIRRASVCR